MQIFVLLACILVVGSVFIAVANDVSNDKTVRRACLWIGVALCWMSVFACGVSVVLILNSV